MPTIKVKKRQHKFDYPAENYSNVSFRYWVDITETSFEIKLFRTVDDAAEENILWHKVPVSSLITPGFVDQTWWTVDCEQEKTPFTGACSIIEPRQIIDLFGNSVVSKPKAVLDSLSGVNNIKYDIFVPDADDQAGMLSFNYRLIMDEDTTYVVDGPASEYFVEEDCNLSDLISPITLSSGQTSVQPDGSITINVQSDTFIDEVFLEQVYGSLNKSRVKLVNGVGKFTMYATDMEAGDIVRVKAGHRKYTGIADFSAPVQ